MNWLDRTHTTPIGSYHSGHVRRPVIRVLLVSCLVTLVGLSGCEMDSFLNPSTVGSWEGTPQMVPILDRLAVIDEKPDSALPRTPVRPEDLKVDRSEQKIGAGDTLTVTIFELVVPGQESVQTRRVDGTGKIRLPVLGSIEASGRTPSQLEKDIRTQLANQGVLEDATVSVVVSQSRQRTYSIVGAPDRNSTAFGTYVIPQPDYRLLEALALARGVPGRTQSLLIFRQATLSKQTTGQAQSGKNAGQNQAPAEEQSSAVIDQLERALEGNGQSSNNQNAGGANGQNNNDQGQPHQPAPESLEQGLDTGNQSPKWIKVGNQWVRAGQVPEDLAQGQPSLEDALGKLVTQRIIEVPYQKLINGDMRYNLVIRPDDVIRVPDPNAGFVYVMGEINRPGAYNVPGEKELTLKQLVASAGNLSGLAIPQRVDLTRRVEEDYEATVRLNLKAIFHGNEPDIYLKQNDLINVGTNYPATPIAVFRNGLRTTYGFGFIVDRNFGSDIFGAQNGRGF